MPKIINLEQGSQAWLDFRKNHLGASEANIIMGINPYGQTPYKLWLQKLGIEPPQQVNPAMQRGKDLEKEAIAIYQEKHGIQLHQHVIQSDEYPFLIASMDGIDEAMSCAIEVKCLNLAQHDTLEISDLYWTQLQHQMYCCCLDSITYIGYHPNSTQPYWENKVSYDAEFMRKYLIKAKEFEKCLNTLTEPEKTDKDFEDMSNDAKYIEAEFHFNKAREKVAEWEGYMETARQQLISLSKGNNCKGRLTTLTNVVSKGRIEYAKIPVLQGIDLEPYRGKPTTSVRINMKKVEN